jgi:hypothetical protein
METLIVAQDGLPPPPSGPAPQPDQHDALKSGSPSGVPQPPAEAKPALRRWRKRLLRGAFVVGLVGGLGAGGWFVRPWLATALNTVSTDDAYVNGHVTFVAPRVPGQVSEVRVDDNYRVKKGDLLVELDPEPYRVQVAIKKAAVEAAEADLVAAQAHVRGQVAQAWANRFKLEHSIEDVDNQIANLRAGVATLNSRKAVLEWDWMADPFWRVQTLAVVIVLALGGLLYRELTFASPVINFRVLRERNFAACCILIFSAFAVLYAATVALPGLLQTLFGYDAFTSGLVLSPAGFFSIAMLVVVGALLGRGVDARWLIAPGLAIMAAGGYWMAVMNLQISPWQVVWPRVVLIVGLSLIFAPVNVAAFLYTPNHLRGAAIGLLALLRNEGGSFGTSMGQTIQQRREQFHLSRLDDSLNPLNPHVEPFLESGRAFFTQQTGDPAQSQQMAVQALADLRQQQAASLAYFDVFWMCAAVGAALVLLVFLMKRSVAEKGAHIGAE